MEQNQSFQRHVAHKIKINDVVSSPYHQVEGADPNFLKHNNKEISRMNVIAAIVDKNSSESYANLVLDDASGTISARLFEQLEILDKVQLGDVVNVVGRPREYNGEKYILLETIQKINPLWAKVRNLELGQQAAQPEASQIEQPQQETPQEEELVVEKEEAIVVEQVGGESPNSKILKQIKERDHGDGVAVEDLTVEGIENTDTIIELLLKEGNIFEIKPGRVKILE